MKKGLGWFAAGLLASLAQTAVATTLIDDAALTAPADGRNWAAFGRDYSEQRYSPLDQIDV